MASCVGKELDELGSGEDPGLHTKRTITAFQLIIITFFLTSGGPFGIEPTVGAAGPFYALLGILLVPVLWSLPQALMAAELSMLIGENGGNVVWVQHAFGDFIGWINAFNFIAYCFTSNTLYVVLFVDYLPTSWDLTWYEAWGIKIFLVLMITAINLLGMDWISRLSWLLFIVILTPFVIEVIMMLVQGKFHFDSILADKDINEVRWGDFLSTLIWCYGGFDNIGALAGEVKGGSRTYLLGIVLTLPLNIMVYLIPTAFGYSLVPDRSSWDAGSFTDVSKSLASWLGIFMLIASIISNSGQYNTSTTSLSRCLWAMGNGGGTIEEEDIARKGQKRMAKMLPSIVSYSWQRRDPNSSAVVVIPAAAIIISGIASLLLSLLPFSQLVQVSYGIRTLNLNLEFAALIFLRLKMPNAPRPFKIPGGLLGTILITLPPLYLSVFMLVEDDWMVWAIGGAFNAFVVVAYVIKVLWTKAMERWYADRVSKAEWVVNERPEDKKLLDEDEDEEKQQEWKDDRFKRFVRT